MVFGFNTDVRVGELPCHVQTEDHGPYKAVIETIIYIGGRVVHRLSRSYHDLLELPDFGEAVLQQRLEEQHRAVIEELRDGTLKLDAQVKATPPPAAAASAATSAEQPAGVKGQLLNPASWFAAGTATLRIEVKSQPENEPLAEAQVEVVVQGAQGPVSFGAKTDKHGRVELVFPLPRMGPGGAELVIRAAGASGQDEIRYTLRPKARSSPA